MLFMPHLKGWCERNSLLLTLGCPLSRLAAIVTSLDISARRDFVTSRFLVRKDPSLLHASWGPGLDSVAASGWFMQTVN